MGSRASSVYSVFLLLLWVPYKAQGQALPEAGISDMDFDALLKDLRGNKFFTAATVLGLLARPYLRPSMTLLIPTDTSLAEAVAFPPKDYASLIKFHILEKNFDFKQLRLLPVGTWIPTALPKFGVQVTSNTAANFSLNGAQLTSPNLCPSLVRSFMSCQGISAILNPNSQLSPRPAPNPFLFGAAPPTNAPPSSPPIFLPPSFAPTSPPSNTPSTPAPSPSPLTSAALAPSPSTTIPPSLFPLPPSPSPVVLPSVPTPSTPAPSIPTVPSPSTSTGTSPPLVLTNPRDLTPGVSENEATSLSIGATLLTTVGACVLTLALSL